jgi:hypothetical protein
LQVGGVLTIGDYGSAGVSNSEVILGDRTSAATIADMADFKWTRHRLDPTGTAAQISFWNEGTTGAEGQIRFGTNAGGSTGQTPTDRMAITSAGLVGIGTTTPGATLDVNGNFKVNGSAQTLSEKVQASVNSGTSLTLGALTSGTIYRVTLTGNATITLPSDPGVTNSMAQAVVVIKQDATGSRSLTWSPPGSDAILWQGGSTPTVCSGANQTTMYQFMKINGDSNWYGTQVWRECP